MLAPDRFDTPAKVEDDLLARVLPNAYQPPAGSLTSPYDLPHAARWLRRIAAEMTERGIRDLDWRQLPEWAPAPVRVLLNGLLGIGVGALTGGAIARFTDELGERSTPGSVPFAVMGLALGLPAGLAAGLPAGLVTGVPAGLAYGLLAGIGNGLVVGLGFVVAFALIDGLTTTPVGTTAAASPISDWRQDRQYSRPDRAPLRDLPLLMG